MASGRCSSLHWTWGRECQEIESGIRIEKYPSRRQGAETNSFEHDLNVDQSLHKLRRTISQMARPNMGGRFMGNPHRFRIVCSIAPHQLVIPCCNPDYWEALACLSDSSSIRHVAWGLHSMVSSQNFLTT